MKFLQIFLTLLIAGSLVACGGSNTRPDSSNTAPTATVASTSTVSAAANTASEGAIRVRLTTPFDPKGMNDPAVMNECNIHAQLPDFVRDQAKAKGIEVVLVPEVSAEDKGKNLVLSFMRTQSSGNAFTGHYKYTEIKAVLYEDGKQLADLTAGRRSGGGAFGGYKGSCSVMGRTVRTLGEDVAQWLVNPVAGARAGNL